MKTHLTHLNDLWKFQVIRRNFFAFEDTITQKIITILKKVSNKVPFRANYLSLKGSLVKRSEQFCYTKKCSHKRKKNHVKKKNHPVKRVIDIELLLITKRPCFRAIRAIFLCRFNGRGLHAFRRYTSHQISFVGFTRNKNG